jgi:hypothetical protein
MPRTPMPRTPMSRMHMSRMHTPSFILEVPLRTTDERAEAGRVVAAMAVRVPQSGAVCTEAVASGRRDSQGIIA